MWQEADLRWGRLQRDQMSRRMIMMDAGLDKHGSYSAFVVGIQNVIFV